MRYQTGHDKGRNKPKNPVSQDNIELLMDQKFSHELQDMDLDETVPDPPNIRKIDHFSRIPRIDRKVRVKDEFRSAVLPFSYNQRPE